METSYLVWSCEDGYMMAGEADSVVWFCRDNGEWIGETPICTEEQRCPYPPLPAFGNTTSSSLFRAGDVITYQCDEGRALQGSDIITCNYDGSWMNEPPVCPIGCNTGNGESRYSQWTCFFTISDGNDWDEARTRCEDNGGHLALVKDSQTQAHLVNYWSGRSGDSYWIGAREGRDWRWASNDSPIEQLYWSVQKFENAQGCMELSRGANGDYSWKDAPCTDQHGFICSFDGQCADIIIQTGRATMNHGNMCFTFIEGIASWEIARDNCTNRGGILVEIRDDATDERLSAAAKEFELASLTETRWWIGGKASAAATIRSERVWYWIDDTRVDFTAWGGAEPNGIIDDCIEMTSQFSYNYKWNDGACDDTSQYPLCQKGVQACGDPGVPIYGSHIPAGKTTFDVGTQLIFKCEPGYQLIGDDALTCGASGSWSATVPVCQAINCMGYIPSITGICNVIILGREYRQVAVYRCCSGHYPTTEPVTYCTSDGTWAPLLFQCLEPTITVASATIVQDMDSQLTGAIAGGAGGGLFMLVLFILLIVLIIYKRRETIQARTDIVSAHDSQSIEIPTRNPIADSENAHEYAYIANNTRLEYACDDTQEGGENYGYLVPNVGLEYAYVDPQDGKECAHVEQRVHREGDEEDATPDNIRFVRSADEEEEDDHENHESDVPHVYTALILPGNAVDDEYITVIE